MTGDERGTRECKIKNADEENQLVNSGNDPVSEMKSEENVENYALFIWLTIVQLLFFTCSTVISFSGDRNLELLRTRFVDHLIYNFHWPLELWGHLTCSLIHLDFWQFLSNISLQLIFGIPLERKFGSKRAALIFIGGVLGGSLFSACFKTVSSGASGSSGGSYALLAAYAVGLLFNIKKMNFWLRVGPPITWMVDFADWLFQTDFLQSDYHAQLGGAVMGFLLSLVLLSREMKLRSSSKKIIIYSAFILVALLSSLLVVANIIIILNLPVPRTSPTLNTESELPILKLQDELPKHQPPRNELSPEDDLKFQPSLEEVNGRRYHEREPSSPKLQEFLAPDGFQFGKHNFTDLLDAISDFLHQFATDPQTAIASLKESKSDGLVPDSHNVL